MDKRDTSPEAMKVVDDIYRRMSPAKKWRLIADACGTGQQLAMAGIRMQHPDWNERQVWREWARRHLGDELFNKAYGADPNE